MNELKSFPDEVVDAWNKAIHREYEKRLNEIPYQNIAVRSVNESVQRFNDIDLLDKLMK
jgi:hypothetical protein